MHRFVWNLRYAGPAGLGEGVWVLPGTYSVKLTVEGKSYTRKLTVLNDPRVKATPGDLAKQQAFARQVEDELAKVTATAEAVRSTLKQLADLETKAAPELAAKLKSYEDALSAQTELHAVPPGFGQPGGAPEKLGSLAYVEGAMGALQPAVESADGAPSPDALKGLALQKAHAAKAAAAWQKLKAAREPGLNQELKTAGLPLLGGQ